MIDRLAVLQRAVSPALVSVDDGILVNPLLDEWDDGLLLHVVDRPRRGPVGLTVAHANEVTTIGRRYTIDAPSDVAVDAAGNVYITEYGADQLQRIDAAGMIHAFAGTDGWTDLDGDRAVSSMDRRLKDPTGVAVGLVGEVFFVDRGRIWKLDSAAGQVSAFAGTGEIGHSGDGGPAIEAQFGFVQGVAADGSGNVYIADSGNHEVRKIDVMGTITTDFHYQHRHLV